MCPLICPGCCGRYARQMSMACWISPALRYSLASGAKYRRGFSSNFFCSSSMRAVVAMTDSGVFARPVGGGSEGTARYISQTEPVNQKSRRDLILAHVAGYLFKLADWHFVLLELPQRPPPPLRGVTPVLQTMRSAAKYIWLFIVVAF